MSLDKIIVILAAFFGIGFTYWFFLMKKEKVVAVGTSPDSTDLNIDIVVKGGYSPQAVSIPVGKVTKLSFTREDPSSCLEEVVLPDFRVRKFLPLNQKVVIEIKPEKIGEFNFSCGMNMFHGKIVVK